jgi:hypothetical protein
MSLWCTPKMGLRRRSRQSVLERAADLDRREAALTAREEALDRRMDAAHEILAAANERDAVADARDTGADVRDRRVDRAEFLAGGDPYGDNYGNHLPQRRDAALDRQHAKGNRNASQDDRIALTGELDEGEPSRPELPDEE